MYISKVSATNFYGVNPKAAIKNAAKQSKRVEVDFNQFAYSIPEKAVSKKEVPNSALHDMSPKQIDVKGIISSNEKTPEEKAVKFVLDSSMF